MTVSESFNPGLKTDTQAVSVPEGNEGRWREKETVGERGSQKEKIRVKAQKRKQ